METPLASLDPQTLAKLSGLAVRARHIVEGYVAGLHRSPYRGFSIEFAEHREYTQGDDLRYLDWKVFGRTDKFYLKQFEDETNLLCYLVVDTSESMQYQSDPNGLSKAEYAAALATALTWLVLQQQDAVGLVTCDAQLRQVIRPSTSPLQLQRVISALESSPVDSTKAAAASATSASGQTALGKVLHQLAARFAKRGLVIIVSDLLDSAEEIVKGLAHLRHGEHDVAVLCLRDLAEREFPFAKLTEFEGLEGLGNITADPFAVKAAYLAEMEAHQRQMQAGCRASGIELIEMTTNEPLDQALARFLTPRLTRMR